MNQSSTSSIKNAQRRSLVYLFFAIISVVFLCVLAFSNSAEKTTTHVPMAVLNSNSDVSVSFERHPTKQWTDAGSTLLGAQYDGVLKNVSQNEILGWKLEIEVPPESYIDSSWNGQFELKDGILKITSADFNNDIPGGDSVTFGCIMYTPASYKSASATVKIEYYSRFVFRGSTLYWIIFFLLFASFIACSTVFLMMFRINRLRAIQQRDKDFIDSTIRLVANTVEVKDSYTRGHSIRVGSYARKIGEALGLPEKELDNLYYAALLHDVGKIGIPDAILLKPGRLNTSEIEVMHSHANLGGDILADFTQVPGIVNIVRHHHERYDGAGYPDNLEGIKIPYFSRIICIADSFDAMTSVRCYHSKMSIEDVVEEIKKCSGTQFDPELAELVIKLVEKGDFLEEE
ncbi:MAG: HD domain-containing protein [Treponemataceae bacterium]|nr:HD domain-containing protein [Treponemataceae bacterium]